MAQPATDGQVPSWLRSSAAWTWRLLLLLVAFLAVLWLVARLLVVSLPLIVAVIVATLTVPPTRWLQSRGLRPGAAASIVVIGGIGLITAILALLAPSFVDQLSQLGQTLADAWDRVLAWLDQGPLNYDSQRVEELLVSVRESIMSGEGGTGVVSGVLTGAGIVFEAVAGFLLFFILLFFITKDGEVLVDWFQARTPPRYRETLAALGTRSWSALGGYVRGTATIALIDALGIAIGLIILRVPLVGPLTILVFLGGFVPVIGAFIAGLVAVLVALAAGGVVTALLALAVIIGVQQVEGNLLQPIIMRRAVALHPVVILLALGSGVALAGILGAFLAVPVAAVTSAIGNELRLRSEDGALTQRDTGAGDEAPAED